MSNYFDKGNNRNTNRESHSSSDVDESPDSLHHTLGGGRTQASPGNHNHDDSGWQDVIFEGSWVNFDTRTVQFTKTHDDFVHMRGIAKSGVIGTTVFTFPVGYCPETRLSPDHHFPAVSNNSFGVITVEGNGLVTVTVGSNVFVDFSSVVFKAAV